MKIPWTGQLAKHPQHILEEAGYHEFVDPNTNKTSYIQRIGRRFYPRFHVYVNRYADSGGEIDIHIDQKQASYAGSTAHQGEYNGPIVEVEAVRIGRWVAHYGGR